MNKPTVGVVGLGIMGYPMAVNISKKGYGVVVANRSLPPLARARQDGLKTAASFKELATQCDVIVVMVTDPKAVFGVLEGDSGVLSGAVMGKTLIQMSTIDEQSTLRAAELARGRGMKFLDCPVAGSKKQVEAAELIILAGGDLEIIDNVRPILMSMGKAVVHAGEIGKGTALKLCMNLLVAQMTTAICESTALAKVQGVNPQKIFDVIKQSPALNCGYFQIKEKSILNEDFTPAFSLHNMLKDVIFMNEAAKSHRLGLPVTQAVRFLMEATSTEGFGNEDLTVVTKLLKPYSERRN